MTWALVILWAGAFSPEPPLECFFKLADELLAVKEKQVCRCPDEVPTVHNLVLSSCNEELLRVCLDVPKERLVKILLKLVLASGSLKELAQAYHVSYPTIRIRLDRVISKLKGLMEGLPTNPMNELLADLVERGEMTYSAAVIVRHRYRKQNEKDHE
jgi:hypothetical protein